MRLIRFTSSSQPPGLRSQYELAGNTFHLRSDSFGAVTLWTLRADHPIWGQQRIVIRSALPLKPGQEVQHPEITPLGQGHAATYLALVNATGAAITTAGSSSLHEVARSNLFQAREFVNLPDTETHVYRIGGDGIGSEKWSLKAQIPPAADQVPLTGDPSARVLSAELELRSYPTDRSKDGPSTRPRSERADS